MHLLFWHYLCFSTEEESQQMNESIIIEKGGMEMESPEDSNYCWCQFEAWNEELSIGGCQKILLNYEQPMQFSYKFPLNSL